MKVKIGTLEYECVRAVRSTDSAVLYPEDGGTVVELSGVSDWTAIQLEGGTWETEGPSAQEQLRADVDFIAAMTGVSL